METEQNINKKVRLKRREPKVENMRFTLERLYGKDRVSRKELTPEGLLELLHDGKHRQAVEALRESLPKSRGIYDEPREMDKVAWVVPSCLRHNKSGRVNATVFNGIVLLNVPDVYSADEVKRLKQRAMSLPMTLGILGLAAAAIALFAGNGGAGTQKFIMLIFAVSICLFAPTFISYVSTSAGGATVGDALGAAEAARVSVGVMP